MHSSRQESHLNHQLLRNININPKIDTNKFKKSTKSLGDELPGLKTGLTWCNFFGVDIKLT